MERVAISHRIKEGLEIRNMKQIDLSRLTGISRSMITWDITMIRRETD